MCDAVCPCRAGAPVGAGGCGGVGETAKYISSCTEGCCMQPIMISGSCSTDPECGVGGCDYVELEHIEHRGSV